MSSRSTTSLPSRATASCESETLSRTGGSFSISAAAASIRNFGFVVRAGAPRRSQASSLRSRFCRRDSLAAACRSRSTRCRMYAAYPPSNGSTMPSCTSQVSVDTSSRNHRSWVTTTRPPCVRRPALLQVLREPGDALDVEVVGGLVEEDDVPVVGEQRGERDAAALAAAQDRRRRHATGCRPAHQSASADQSRDDVADAGIARPLVLGASVDDEVGDRLSGGQLVGLVEHPDRDAAAARDAAGVGLLPPGEQPQQRRLAVAVAADDADAVALVDAEGDAVEDDLGRVLEGMFSAPSRCAIRSPPDSRPPGSRPSLGPSVSPRRCGRRAPDPSRAPR